MNERKQKKLVNASEYTYGEVVFLHFIPLLEYVKPKPGEIFYDLGCGSGKPMVIASLIFPFLKVCKGIEFLKELANLAENISKDAKNECKQ